MPTVEEIIPELSKAKVFTTLDATKGFWQLCLDEESSKLTTFWTPFGRYKFKRLPFGISSAPEIFQNKQHEIVHGLDGIVSVHDDILVYGCGQTIEEATVDHNVKLEKLLKRIREKNLKLNKSKMKLCQQQVRFFGHLFTSEGIKPDPTKVEAIERMPKPENVKDVQTFLGMINYLSKFMPALSSVSEPIRKLTRNESDFVWKQEQESCFNNLKKMVTEAPILNYYDVRKDLILQCDASSHGLGAVLLQEDKPIAFASRTLTKTETRYAQIEKEMLAILFACRRFEQYIVGKKNLVQSNHKPLENIYKKALCTAPKRLQRMLLAMQRYSYEIKFIPGRNMYIADLLSRLHLKESENYKHEEIYDMKLEEKFDKEIESVNNIEFVPLTDERIEEIRKNTLEDEQLQDLKKYILRGWPKDLKSLNPELKLFYKIRDELSVDDEIIVKSQRLVIPTKIRKDILKRLHHSHQGVEMSLKLARDSVYWPGISKEVNEHVGNCNACIKFSQNNRKMPMQTVQIPEYPFQVVSMDLFEVVVNCQKKMFVILVDHYSDFYELEEIRNMSASTIIEFCKKCFARHGIPQLVIADNGTHFKNELFCKCAKEWEFKLSTSAPFHHEANGKAEAAVNSAKTLIKKTSETGKDFYKALLVSRNVPNKIGSSPVQRLFSRRTRCSVPVKSNSLKPTVIKNVVDEIIKNRKKVKFHADKKARNLKPLEVGKPVFVKLKGKESPWNEAVVKEKINDRSYVVWREGKNFRRDRTHIKEQANAEAGMSQETPEDITPTTTTQVNASAGGVNNKGVLNTEPAGIKSRRPSVKPVRYGYDLVYK